MTTVGEAIAIIEDCRRSHVDWADWQEATPDWRSEVTPESPGGPEFHREWVEKYDRVLEVLRALQRNRRLPALSPDERRARNPVHPVERLCAQENCS